MMVEDIANTSIEVNKSHVSDINEEIDSIKAEACDASGEEGDDDMVDYKTKYRNLKRKLKCLLYEQECFHEELRKFQRKCMRVNRDKSFLLDRLLQYEQPTLSSDDDNTSSSEEEVDNVKKLNTMKNKNKNKNHSTSKESSNKQTGKTKNNVNTMGGVKVRCRRVENGKQCTKLVSVKVKSGICYVHRQEMDAEKQGQSSSKSTSNVSKSSPPKPKTEKHSSKPSSGGGKDIGQIREAMEANARECSPASPGMYGDEDDDLVIDLPH